jgi:hypothetical protein
MDNKMMSMDLIISASGFEHAWSDYSEIQESRNTGGLKL